MNNIPNLPELTEQINQLAQDVISETDSAKTQKLIDMFNWHLSKKNVLRVLKLNNLFDSVTDQMSRRFETKPDQFSNSDLLDYMKVVQGAIDTSSKVLEQLEEPPTIIQNNTQINVNLNETFDKESRARILAAIQATLDAAKTATDDFYEDKTEGDISNEQ